MNSYTLAILDAECFLYMMCDMTQVSELSVAGHQTRG